MIPSTPIDPLLPRLFCSIPLWLSLLLGGVLNYRTANSRIHEYETTRQKSTAGAGIGSILLNESATLNPAPIAFFNNSSFYLQRESTEYAPLEEGQTSLPRHYDKEYNSLGVIIADSTNNLHGSLSYQRQQEGEGLRKRMTFSLASPMKKDYAFGLSYRRTTDELTFQKEPSTYNQFVLGCTHIINKNFTVGAILIDPLRSRPEDVRAMVGAQFIVQDIISFMLDFGGNYRENLVSTGAIRGAVQLNFFKHFFLRAGVFRDYALNEEGNGFGLAWLGPRFVVEASMKKTRDIELPVNSTPLEMTETSLAVSYFF